MRVRRNASCAMPRACTRKIVKDQVRRQPRELPVHRPRRHDGRLGASDGEARRRHETTVSGHCPTGRGRQPRGRWRHRLLGRQATIFGRAPLRLCEARRDPSPLLGARVERHVRRRQTTPETPGINIRIKPSSSADELGNLVDGWAGPRPTRPCVNEPDRRDPSRVPAPPQIIKPRESVTIVVSLPTNTCRSLRRHSAKFRNISRGLSR